MNKNLYLLLAALARIIPLKLWPYFETEWSVCPECGDDSFCHKSTCKLEETTESDAEDFAEELRDKNYLRG